MIWPHDDLPFPAYGSGSCINCGFLCVRNVTVHYVNVREVTPDDRVRGTFGQALQTMPAWCFAHGTNLKAELDLLGQHKPIEERMLLIIREDRDCSRFFPYREGFSPEEHAAEQRTVKLEQGRRRFEEGMERDRRQFEQGIERSRRRFEIALGVLLGVLPLIAVIVGILSLVHGW